MLPSLANRKWAVECPGMKLHIVEHTAAGNWFGDNNLTHCEKQESQRLIRETVKDALLREPEAGDWSGYIWVAL